LSQPEPVAAPEPGALYLAEIREQPAAIRRLLGHRAEYARVAEAAAKRNGGLVRMVGHGSSDNAASYGVYGFGILAGLTALRDSISLTVYYNAKIDLRGSLVVALSQSGQTPDVLEYVTRARREGAFTVGVTNHPESELARTADAVLPLAAGDERAVAATKTYVNQLAAIALLAALLGGRGDEVAAGLEEVADELERHLPMLERSAAAIAVPY
jgi:glucosamine--fructose-6-phosphate aminotransferase (isomerizing)